MASKECPEASIVWTDFSYSVNKFPNILRPPKVILNRLNGCFAFNTLSCIMGPSGAGKSTFLNCLCGDATPANSGLFFASNCPRTYAFIEQNIHESILPNMNIGSILRYAFAFKNPQAKSANSHVHIRKVLNDLLLPEEILNRKFVNCSGGEQKRIAIAQELMSLQMPSFLYIDEPTTGLDSQAALQVICCLKALATNYRMTVVTSIHVPNSEILQCFDKIYVLAKGGEALYDGSPDGIEAFLKEEVDVEVRDDQPPIEVLMKLACAGRHDAQVAKLAAKVRSTHSALQSSSSLLPITFSSKTFSILNCLVLLLRLFHYTFLCNFNLVAFGVLLQLPTYLIVASFFPAGMAEVDDCQLQAIASGNISAVCVKNDLDKSILFRENWAYLTYTFIFASFTFISISTIHFAQLVKVSASDQRNRWYSVSTFYLSSSIVSFAEVSLYALVISTTVYFASSQQAADNYTLNWSRFAMWTALYQLLAFYYQSFGNLLGVIFANAPVMALLSSVLVNLQTVLLNNLIINIDGSGNLPLLELADLVATKYLTKLLCYIILVFERCRGGEVSVESIKYDVRKDHLVYYCAKLTMTIIALRLLAFAYMYGKFCGFGLMQRLWLSRKESLKTKEEHVDTSGTHALKKEAPKLKFEHLRDDSPVLPTVLAFRHLTLFLSSSIYEFTPNSSRPQNTRSILRNLSGHFALGSLNGLMGPSGAGKTSLLNVINGNYKSRLDAKTAFYLSKHYPISTCFIRQDISTHLVPGLTVKQSLMYASQLKNIREEGCDHEQIVERLLVELALSDVKDNRVERCSGGEKKRLALGFELTAVKMPNLVCIDEPTSGLDSNSAEIVISCLRSLTRAHSIAIIISLHQPNTFILQQIDQLYVLARGGVCIYAGPFGGIQSHLSSIPEIAQTENQNQFPIEVLIKYSCCGAEDGVVQKMVRQNEKKWESAQFESQATFNLDGVQPNRCRFSLHSSLILSFRYLNQILGYLWLEYLITLLFYVSFSIFLRQIFPAAIAIPSGCFDIESESLSPNGTCTASTETLKTMEMLLDNYRFTYHLSSTFLFFCMLQTALTFRRDFIGHFSIEQHNGWYSTGAFYLSRCTFDVIALIPLIAVHIYIVDIYEVIRPGTFWSMGYLLILGSIATQGISHLMSIISGGHLLLLTAILSLIYTIITLLSNFFLSISKMNYIYKFISNFVTTRWVFEGLILQQYGFGRCHSREMQPILYMMGELGDEDYGNILLMLTFNLLWWRLLALAVLLLKMKPTNGRRERAQRIVQFTEKICIDNSMNVGV